MLSLLKRLKISSTLSPFSFLILQPLQKKSERKQNDGIRQFIVIQHTFASSFSFSCFFFSSSSLANFILSSNDLVLLSVSGVADGVASVGLVTFRQTPPSHTASSFGLELCEVDPVDGPGKFASTFVALGLGKVICARPATFFILSYSSWLEPMALVTISIGCPLAPIKNSDGNGTSLSVLMELRKVFECPQSFDAFLM